MKEVAKRLLDATVTPIMGRIARSIPREQSHTLTPKVPGVVDETFRRAVADSADYAESQMRRALCFRSVEDLRRHAFAARTIDGLLVEFGVWRGHSISFFASITEATIHGFDSFEGLSEDWSGWELPKGYFSLQGVVPEVPANVRLIKGWFDTTLPKFLRENPEPFAFMHLDCDTYEAAATVLRIACDRLVKATVIVFDEYFGYRGWRMGEFKAWQEFVASKGIHYEYLAFSDHAVSVRIT